METFNCGPLQAPRLWTGLWQLSSNAWGTASVSNIRKGMARHVDMGYTAFGTALYTESPSLTRDNFTVLRCNDRQADHYGSAEIIFGQFRNKLPSSAGIVGATKWCVFKNVQPSREVVQAAVEERRQRMQSARVDLLQFHWQDYSDKGYLLALQYLCDLRQEGMLTAIDEICTQLGPGAIATNQVQFSLIDTRPLHGMADVCDKHNIKLLTYGTICGGFLADKWLNRPQPDLYSSDLTPSQRKEHDLASLNILQTTIRFSGSD
ncbi:hypothetical protein HGRIS_007277 [Hohenbuehelia grisea]|uniref:NADP-dependent oxidoreductase domain-containing protein n=1 Tax=Hohenbuehelia grisea TaxID=104357 RepID=A0ABR3JBY9_9AGAR